mgnify:CR=1 FL=1
MCEFYDSTIVLITMNTVEHCMNTIELVLGCGGLRVKWDCAYSYANSRILCLGLVLHVM